MPAPSRDGADPRTDRAALTDRLRAFPVRPLDPTGHRASAVAVAVADDGTGRGIWLTRRAATLRAHSGQFALPGGRLDPGETAEDAALRELDEELGVRVDPGQVLGRLDDFATRSGYVITPVVVWIGGAPPLRPNPAEVAHVHFVPFGELDVAPTYSRIAESDRPVIGLPLVGTLIHAPTAAVLHQFTEVALHGRPTRVAHLEQPLFAWR
ncbi:NUDIX hydrolase [Saccharopolyspora sp. CA-218241]|uniref:NUDIX hydrolase n=1 Tax=Saccharopolyspora sp. CA-218241 TaxID=3240027 RepID=UPI003D956675